MAIFTFTFILCKCILTVVFYIAFLIVKGLMLLITTIVLSLSHFIRWIVVRNRKA